MRLALCLALVVSARARNISRLFERDSREYPPVHHDLTSACSEIDGLQHLARGPRPRALWLDAYTKVASLIPAVPAAIEMGAYPRNTDLEHLCSYKVDRCLRDQVYDAPSGIIAIAFDDGPFLEPSAALYKFLKEQEQSATHFVVGSQIALFPDLLRQADKQGHELGVHTWSHAALTTLSDVEIVGEIGWTMQIIFDLTGKVPRLWRPPYGDNDDRVRAIAQHVFGLSAPIMWRPHTDTYDWCLSDAGTSACSTDTYAYGEFGPRTVADLDNVRLRNVLRPMFIRAQRLDFLIQAPKSPGLLILEHELSLAAIGGFVRALPKMRRKGWKTLAVGQALRISAYQEASPWTSWPFYKFGIPLVLSAACVVIFYVRSRRYPNADEEKAASLQSHLFDNVKLA